MTQVHAFCAVCMRESVNFEQLMFDEALPEEETSRLLKSFVFSQTEDFCAHAACLGVTIGAVVKRSVYCGEENRSMDIYILKEDDWKDHMKLGDLCHVCSREGFLSATIKADNTDQVVGKAHLLCALGCKSLLLENVEELKFSLETDSNNSSGGECTFCNNELRLEGWTCDEKDCKRCCHEYCYFFDRKEKMLNRNLESNQMLTLPGEEVNNSKTTIKNWYRKLKAGESFIEPNNFRIDLAIEDFAEEKWFGGLESSLHQSDITKNTIYEKMKELSYPQKPQKCQGLGTYQETFCDLHSTLLSTYCNCRDNKERFEPAEIQSIYCEDCGIWFHKGCVDYFYSGRRSQCRFVPQLEMSQVQRG